MQLYLFNGVADRLRPVPRRNTSLPRRVYLWRGADELFAIALGSKRPRPPDLSADVSDPKRRKVQKSVEDLKKQTQEGGFAPGDLRLFDQPYHEMNKQMEGVGEISDICEAGAPTAWWAKNSRKLSARNVEDKLAHRTQDPIPDLNAPLFSASEDNSSSSSDDDEDEEDDDESIEDIFDNDDEDEQPTLISEITDDGQEVEIAVDRTVQIGGRSSHLYGVSSSSAPSVLLHGDKPAASEVSAHKRQSRAIVNLATQDVNQVVNKMVRPNDYKRVIFTRFLLCKMQPRRNLKVRVIMEDKTTGERKQIIRSVPYYHNSLKSADGNGGAPAVHLHLRRWEENWLLRTPIAEWAERACIKGENCQGHAHCFDIKATLREYVSPHEHAHWMTFGEWPHLGQPARQCLMCKRDGVSGDYWSARAARRSANPTNQLLVEFYNIVNVPGEYHIGQCAFNPGPYVGLWGPVAKHHLPNYTPTGTTLGDLTARALLAPSASLKSPLPQHLMHQISVVMYAQTGFVEVTEASSAQQSAPGANGSLVAKPVTNGSSATTPTPASGTAASAAASGSTIVDPHIQRFYRGLRQ